MENTIFRSVEFWKSSVMTMPDNSFYELMRSVFGKIKTPFNKQQLLNDLETFLLRKDIQDTISAYINETDAKIISAIAVFNEPFPVQLENFLCESEEELNQAQLQDHIVNLEERFILYRFTDNKNSRLALNPLLEPVLTPVAADTSVIFPKILSNKNIPSNESLPVNSTIIDDLTLSALLSFAVKNEILCKPDNIIRKRIIDEGKILFPGIDLETIFGSLQILGLFYIDSGCLVPDKKLFDNFALLSARERSEYTAASILIFSELTPPYDILPPLFKNKIKQIIDLIHSFIDSLNIESQYSEKTLKRIIEVLKAQVNINFNTKILFDALQISGLITKITSEIMQIGMNVVNCIGTVNNNPVITTDSNSSILVYPEIQFSDAIKLAYILNICETSTVIRFELNKESAIRCFNNNINADEIIELLNRLSNGNINNSIIWNLKDWEKRHKEVSLKKGIVLQIAEEHRYLAETRPLAALIIETLAPGVYLLNENASNDATEALQKAGIDIIAQCKEKKENNTAVNNYFLQPSSHKLFSAEAVTVSRKYINNNLTTDFLALLEKMQLNEIEKTELTARIERRLVLCESQLKNADIRYEKLEARLMDYAGKQNIAKQAISQQSSLEIIWTIKGKERNIYGIPKSLEKTGNDLILVINSERIPLAKISLLRRIKKSIFEK